MEMICQGFFKQGYFFTLQYINNYNEIYLEWEINDGHWGTDNLTWENTPEMLDMVMEKIIEHIGEEVFYPDAIEMIDNELDLDYLGDLHDLVA